MIILWSIIVLVSSFLASYLINTSAITIIGQRVKKVVPISLVTKIFTWVSIYTIGKISDWNLILIGMDTVGDTAGDWLVSKRWPKFVWTWIRPPRDRRRRKGKRKSKKRTPFTNA